MAKICSLKNGYSKRKIIDTKSTNLSKWLPVHLLKCQNYCNGSWSQEWHCVSANLHRRTWKSLNKAQQWYPYSGWVEQLKDQREDEIKQRMCFLSRLEREKRRHVVSSPHEHVNWPDAPFSDLSYCQFEMEWYILYIYIVLFYYSWLILFLRNLGPSLLSLSPSPK